MSKNNVNRLKLIVHYWYELLDYRNLTKHNYLILIDTTVSNNGMSSNACLYF